MPRGIFLAPTPHERSMRCARKIVTGSIAPAVLIGAVMLAGCGGSDEIQAMTEVKKPFGAGDPKKADAELEQAVRKKLDTDEQLKAAQLIVRADVTRNQITLAGAVPSAALQIKAVELAKGAHAGVIVIDKLIVKPGAANAPAQRRAPL